MLYSQGAKTNKPINQLVIDLLLLIPTLSPPCKGHVVNDKELLDIVDVLTMDDGIKARGQHHLACSCPRIQSIIVNLVGEQ